MTTLGLSMIVKNEAHYLRSCLKSVLGTVSQMVVADTGSTDDTCEIAREFGATVLSVPWENHFANARNAALQCMQTEWVLVLDADEELDREARHTLPKLLSRPDVGGYLTPVRNYVPAPFGRGWDRTTVPNDHRHPRAKDAPAYFTHEVCRLFQRRPEIYFIGRVHELVEDRIRALGLKLPLAGLCIHHFGQLAEQQSRKRKAESYRDLLRLKIQEQPDDPAAWIQLGVQEYEFSRQPQEALRCFQRALAVEPRAVQAWLFTGMILLDLGQYQEALGALQRARADRGSEALLEHYRGDALHNLGLLEEARVAYRQAVKAAGHDPLLQSKLGYTEVRLGRIKAGFAKLQQAAEAAPEVAEIRERLMKACIVADDLPQAAEQAEKLAGLEGTPKSYLRAASIRARLQQTERAAQILCRALDFFPDSIELRSALGQLAGDGAAKAPARAGNTY